MSRGKIHWEARFDASPSEAVAANLPFLSCRMRRIAGGVRRVPDNCSYPCASVFIGGPFFFFLPVRLLPILDTRPLDLLIQRRNRPVQSSPRSRLAPAALLQPIHN